MKNCADRASSLPSKTLFYWFSVAVALHAYACFAATQTRTVAFEYDAATGLVTKEIIEPDNTVSYLPLETYLENRTKLRAVPIGESAGTEAIAPSLENIENGRYQPLSRSIFLYVNAQSLARSEVAAFAEFYMTNAARLAQSARYVPLTDSAYRAGQERLRRRIAGSVWDGAVPVGLSMQELQKREAL